MENYGKRIMFEIIALMLLSQQPLQPFVVGEASYYTVESSSQITASGERLLDEEYTCAMLDGEFGEYYLVVADNGKSVVCRLNDRGPFSKDRVIDLSEAAMRKLDLNLRHGVIDVTVYRLGANPPPDIRSN